MTLYDSKGNEVSEDDFNCYVSKAKELIYHYNRSRPGLLYGSESFLIDENPWNQYDVQWLRDSCAKIDLNFNVNFEGEKINSFEFREEVRKMVGSVRSCSFRKSRNPMSAIETAHKDQRDNLISYLEGHNNPQPGAQAAFNLLRTTYNSKQVDGVNIGRGRLRGAVRSYIIRNFDFDPQIFIFTFILLKIIV